MLREILFKAKRTDNRKWIASGTITRFKENGVMSVYMPVAFETFTCEHDRKTDNITSLLDCRFYKVNIETICQSAGKTDKNGVEIFECDKVRVCLNPEIKTGVVKYNAEIACFCIDFDDGFVTFLDFAIAKKKVGEEVWIEVIGNIHDKED